MQSLPLTSRACSAGATGMMARAGYGESGEFAFSSFHIPSIHMHFGSLSKNSAGRAERNKHPCRTHHPVTNNT
jgi:hypothetical protein